MIGMNVLFILSRDAMFFHGSGEVEAMLLQRGVQLLGHECHFAGLGSREFSEYDAYFIFSVRDDVLELIRKIPQQKPCVFVPQIDDLNSDIAAEVDRCSRHLENLSLIGRDANEICRLRGFFPNRLCFQAEAWFLKPFIYEEKLQVEYKDNQLGYCLCMVSADRDDGLEALAAKFLQGGKRLYVVSDRPSEHLQRMGRFSNVAVLKRVAYGSLEWYMRLENCTSLFEPNAWLTSSVLEALWMGKRVLSPNADHINSLIGADLVFKYSDSSTVESPVPSLYEVRRKIYNYHSNFMAKKILNAIGECADA